MSLHQRRGLPRGPAKLRPTLASPVTLGASSVALGNGVTTITLPDITSVAPGQFVMIVMHRADLTPPAGWTLISKTISSPTFQWVSIYVRPSQGPETVGLTIEQASAGRFIAALLSITGQFTVLDRTSLAGSDLTGAISRTKDVGNVLVWGMAGYFYGTGEWLSAPALHQPVWTGGEPRRLGVFYDDFPAGSRVFTPNGSASGEAIAAIELVPVAL